jgi:predicted phage terminase large subunit-like protein
MNLWQENLYAFTDLAFRILHHQKMVDGGHIRYIAKILQAVVDRRVKNLLITIPPGHSKTFITTNAFLPFLIAKNFRARIFYVSSTSALAIDKITKTRAIMQSPQYKDLFPHIKISNDDKSVIKFKNSIGFIAGKGIDGAITGADADLIVFDDPIDASASRTIIESTEEKIRTSFLTRLRSNGGVDNYGFIVINQRTGEEDISSFFLQNYKIGKHINLPFLEEDDKVYEYEGLKYIRKAGVELNPHQYTKEALKSRIGDFEANDFSKRLFETQYQQNPKPATGQLMKAHDFLFYDQQDLDVKMQKIFMTCDTANKTGTANDYSVMCCWGWTGTRLMLLDMIRGKWEFLDLEKVFNAFYKKWQFGLKKGTYLTSIIIEDKASGTQLYQTAKSYGLPAGLLTAKQRVKDKYSRYSQVGAFIGSQKVYLPHFEVKIDGVQDVRQQITLPFLNEVKTFSKDDTHKHDDICDCLFDACAEVYILPSSYVRPFTRF